MYPQLIPNSHCLDCHYTGCFVVIDERNNPYFLCPSCGRSRPAVFLPAALAFSSMPPVSQAGATSLAFPGMPPASHGGAAAVALPFPPMPPAPAQARAAAAHQSGPGLKCCCEGEVRIGGRPYEHRFGGGARSLPHVHRFPYSKQQVDCSGTLCTNCYDRLQGMLTIDLSGAMKNAPREPFSSYPKPKNISPPSANAGPLPVVSQPYSLPHQPGLLPHATHLKCCCEGEKGGSRLYRHSFDKNKPSVIEHYHKFPNGLEVNCEKTLCKNCYDRLRRMGHQPVENFPAVQEPFSTYPVRAASPTDIEPPAKKRRSSQEVCRTCGGIGCPDC